MILAFNFHIQKLEKCQKAHRIVHAHCTWYNDVCQTVLTYNNNPYLLIKVILFKITIYYYQLDKQISCSFT